MTTVRDTSTEKTSANDYEKEEEDLVVKTKRELEELRKKQTEKQLKLIKKLYQNNIVSRVN